MAYAVTRRSRRNTATLGSPTLGVDWGSLFSNIGTAAVTNVATVGVQALDKVIIGAATPKPATVTLAPTTTASTAVGGIPIWGWALGGMGLVVVLIMAMGMGRR